MFFFYDILQATWLVILESAPWLFLGFFAAGIIHVLLPTSFVRRQFQRPGLSSVLKASAFGVPLPLCSCSVIPVAVSLRRAGASKGATASFLVSTPEIGVDSFLLSYGILGPILAVARALTAFVSAVFVGALVSRLESTENQSQGLDSTKLPIASCCSAKSSVKENSRNKIIEIFRYGFGTLISDLAVVFVTGLFLAGALAVIIPDSFFLSSLDNPWISMLLMLFVSLPMYVCATSSTPIAATLLLKGLNPGAVLVFLLAGPASNIATMLAVRSELGGRVLAIYLSGVAVISLAAGALLNWLDFGFFNIYKTAAELGHHHQAEGTEIFGFLLLFMFFVAIAKKVKGNPKKDR